MSDSNKNFGPCIQLASQVAAQPIVHSILSCSLVRPPPVTSRILPSEIYSMVFCYTQDIVLRRLPMAERQSAGPFEPEAEVDILRKSRILTKAKTPKNVLVLRE
jgi:hypothetical protein